MSITEAEEHHDAIAEGGDSPPPYLTRHNEEGTQETRDSCQELELASPASDQSNQQAGKLEETGVKPESNSTAVFEDLQLPPMSDFPTANHCLVHLKLLHAFQSLKEDIGYTDGLWDIWDTRASGALAVKHFNADGDVIDVTDDTQAHQMALSQLREKRWAVFVARAVDRYEAWWQSMSDGPALTEADMMIKDSDSYESFPESGAGPFWTKDKLPPLDVLLIWHTHMLNPHIYLEDCLRAGFRHLWYHGLPWKLLNEAIDANFDYTLPDDVRNGWETATNRSWDNIRDSSEAKLLCPVCATPAKVPWTTCGMPEDVMSQEDPTLIGFGYGDGDFKFTCQDCSVVITFESLRVAKFIRDTSALHLRGLPMPGTVLGEESGRPEAWPSRCGRYRMKRERDPRTFPNRFIKHDIGISIFNLIVPPSYGDIESSSMESVFRMIEKLIEAEDQAAQTDLYFEPGHRVQYDPTNRARHEERYAIRNVMSRYWDNFSLFGVDLRGAVMRQGIFIDKMYHIDWLHSPAAIHSMERFCEKYAAFLALVQKYHRHQYAPTLEIDLAWHTHQLTPGAYYKRCCGSGRKSRRARRRRFRFIDHEDKVGEVAVSEAFQRTAKALKQIFNEPYSECTCWYCESVHAPRDSAPENHCSAEPMSHISAHNAVLDRPLEGERKEMNSAIRSYHARHTRHPADERRLHNLYESYIKRQLKKPCAMKAYRAARSTHEEHLNRQYEKACVRAKKKGRELPPKEDYYDHWGSRYYMFGPWKHPAYFTPGMYGGGDPGHIGHHGDCVAKVDVATPHPPQTPPQPPAS